MKFFAIFFTACLTFAATCAPSVADPQGHGRGHGHAYGLTGNPGRHLGQLRHLRTASLPDSEVIYALQHQSIYVARLRAMHTIDYNNVRIVRVSPAVKERLHISAFDRTMLAYDEMRAGDGSYQTAQIFGGSNSSLLQTLEAVVAGIVVSNAINNATGGSLGGGTGATLAQVLLNSGIPLSDLLGVFLGGNGILNALVG